MSAIRKEVIIGDCRLILGDCLEVLPTLGKVDAVVTDPPFGTTQCSWDAIIPSDQMWSAIDSVTDDNTPVVLFGCEPFSSLLRTSALHRFKYDWVWDKPKGTGFLNAKKQPLRGHEMVSVFCKGQTPYFPQKTVGHVRKQSFRGKHLQTDVYGQMANDYCYDSTERYPRTVVTFSSDTQNSSVHPTQKPVALMEFLVATYSSDGQTILDFTMGSGTTGVACAKSGRAFIGIERHEPYFDIACERIRKAYAQPDMFVEAAKPVHQQASMFSEDAA